MTCCYIFEIIDRRQRDQGWRHHCETNKPWAIQYRNNYGRFVINAVHLDTPAERRGRRKSVKERNRLIGPVNLGGYEKDLAKGEA